MATFDINDVARRVQFTSTGQDGPYAFTFQVNQASEIQAYRNDTLQTESTHYNTTLNADGTGSITFIDDSGSGGTDHTPVSGDVITIIGDLPLSRTTVFQVGQVNQPTTLETEFDNVVIRQQQIQEITDRSIQLKPTTGRTVTGSGTSGPLYFPYDSTVANNASKVIAYDSAGTSLELGPTTANLITLAGITSDISTVAGISSNVTSVAGNSSNINSVAGNATNINAVASNATNINAVNSNSSNINTVAGISSNITTVAGISSDVTTVAGISSDVTTVAADGTDIGTVATNIANVNTVASGISNINTVATNISNVNTVAGVSSNVTTVAGSIANVNTVATNITGVNSFADRYRVGSSDPTTSLDAGDLFFNTTSNSLKYYDSSAWNVIAATFSIDAASDTTLTSPADGAMLLYDTGTSKWIDNVMSGDATMADTGVITIANDVIGAAELNVSGNGTSGQVLASDGDGTFSWVDGGFESGTKMIFNQTAAPTGWTKDTVSNDDSALRVTTGTVGTGGSSGFATAMATPSVSGTVGLTGDLAAGNLAVSISGSISSTTLTTSEMPSHKHGFITTSDNSPNGGQYPTNSSVSNYISNSNKDNQIGGTSTPSFHANTGSGQAHNHAHTLAGSMTGTPGVGNLAGSLSSATASINVKYVDVIVATKD